MTQIVERQTRPFLVEPDRSLVRTLPRTATRPVRIGHTTPTPTAVGLPRNGFALFGQDAERALGGQYRLLRPIGRGATATVYLADQPAINRQVAIKVLRRGPLARKSLFHDEAMTLGHLQHPNILTVHDYVETTNHAFIVMDYAPAGALNELIDADNLPSFEIVTAIITQVASALDAVHAEEIVHRDVKPANILVQVAGSLTAPGRHTTSRHNERTATTPPWVVLGDFGLALRKGRTGDPADADTLGTEGIIGTPAYLSPEQAKQLPLDGRTDIYSLGVVAYELLTGSLPFKGEGMLDLAVQHVSSDIPPMEREHGHIPATLEAVVRRAMAKTPDQRFSTAGALARAFEAAATAAPRRTPFALPALTQFRLAA